MENKGRKTNLFMDVFGQLVIAVIPLFDGVSLFSLLFIGGTWQLVSNYCHMIYYSKTKIRKLYWKLAWGVVSVLALTAIFGFLPHYPVIDYLREFAGGGLYISLYGGVILYLFYLIISIVDFFNLIKIK